MILPIGACSFKEAMKMGVEVYHNLKVCPFSLLEGDGLYLRLVVKFFNGEVFSWVFEPYGLRMITLVFILS